MEADEFLAHYGVPGMKWGKHKAAADKGISQYKQNLRDGKAAQKAGRTVTEAQAKALKTHGQRKILAGLAIYGGVQVASYALSKAAAGSLAKNFEAAASAGEKATASNLTQVGNLSTYVLRQGANGSWG